MEISLHTLGGVRVFAEGRELTHLPAQRLRCALLVYLAVERQVSRESVLALFWPDRPAERARHTLNQTVYELRKLLGDDWLDIHGDAMSVRGVDVDALAFDRAVDAGNVDGAVRLYRGPFLKDFFLEGNTDFEFWIDRHRGRLAKAYQRTCREEVERRERARDYAGAIAVAGEWLRADPQDDEANHRLIVLLAAAGRTQEALAHYDAYESLLARELEVEPLEETKQLVAQLRSAPPGKPRFPQAAAAPQSIASLPSAPAPVEASPELVAEPPLPPAGQRRPLVRRRSAQVSVLGAIVLLFAALLFWKEEVRSGFAALLPERDHPTSALQRIAVLYFDDRSPGGGLGYLADGLSESLIHELSAVPALTVASPDAVKPFRGSSVPPDSVAESLGVGLVVGGTVFRLGDSVRVNVRLSSAAGEELRSIQVSRPWQHTFGLVDDIVREVSMYLRQELGGIVQVRRWQAETKSPEAWRLVQEAKQAWGPIPRFVAASEYSLTHKELARADSLLARAEELDSAWTEPIVMRGWVAYRHAILLLVPEPTPPEVRANWLRIGLAHAERALAKRPNAPDALELRGTLRFAMAHSAASPNEPETSNLLRSAERDLRGAVSADSTRARGWNVLSALFEYEGRFSEAHLAAEHAYRADAYLAEASAIVYRLASTAFELGEDADAKRWCAEGQRRFQREPPFLYCALMLHAWAAPRSADPQEAVRLLESFDQRTLRVQTALRGRLEMLAAASFARAGDAAQANALAQQARSRTASRDAELLWMEAAMRTLLGEQDEAMRLLTEYVAAHPAIGKKVAVGRVFRPLRGRPDFRALVGTPER